MFGYVMADLAALSDEEKARYQGCYCGLCRRLGTLCKQRSRLTLNYDMTFLILLLESVYGAEGCETRQDGRCIAHPGKNHPSWYSSWTDYGARMNVALTYYKLLDDWQDDRKVLSRMGAAALRHQMQETQRRYPRQCQAMKRELVVLSDLEQRGICNPDQAAGSFGRLMGELFVPDPDDENAGKLRQVGECLGQFIYLLDAGIDLSDDLRHERYNPLMGMLHVDLEPILTMLLSQGVTALQQLPLKWDRELIENIYYSGVWMKYRSWRAEANPKREDEKHE
jgi:hypothetical protein